MPTSRGRPSEFCLPCLLASDFWLLLLIERGHESGSELSRPNGGRAKREFVHASALPWT